MAICGPVSRNGLIIHWFGAIPRCRGHIAPFFIYVNHRSIRLADFHSADFCLADFRFLATKSIFDWLSFFPLTFAYVSFDLLTFSDEMSSAKLLDRFSSEFSADWLTADFWQKIFRLNRSPPKNCATPTCLLCRGALPLGSPKSCRLPHSEMKRREAGASPRGGPACTAGGKILNWENCVNWENWKLGIEKIEKIGNWENWNWELRKLGIEKNGNWKNWNWELRKLEIGNWEWRKLGIEKIGNWESWKLGIEKVGNWDLRKLEIGNWEN